MLLTRREFARITALGAGALMVPRDLGAFFLPGPIPGGTLPPGDVNKFVLPLIKPPAMPASRTQNDRDFYRIAMRQFTQQILPDPHPATTVWSYGSVDQPGTVAEGGTFNYPAFTVEALANRRTTVEWRNELVDADGNFLPHLLRVDQTLHWCNPPGTKARRDGRGTDPTPYLGPVPMVTHVHGAHTSEESDGYAEAWWLPDAGDIPPGYARAGTFYDYFRRRYKLRWDPGSATFDYPNDQPATTLWYHDHALGMTRLNVYAGPAGYWLIRGGDYDQELGYVAPGVGDDPLGEYTEIPIAIQDRSFDADGSLFYPEDRAFFEGLPPEALQIPFIPEAGCDGVESDVSPYWNPEVFGNMMVVNGRTWPYLQVEQRRYRFRFLNGCNSRFLVLKMTSIPRQTNQAFNATEGSFWQIGSDQGFLPAPVELRQLLMAPAERADVIVDFTNFPVGTELYLVNDGPDAPFGGIGLEDLSDWQSTGLVMKFIVKASTSLDTTTPPALLALPPLPQQPAAGQSRDLSLNEEESSSVRIAFEAGNLVLDCADGWPFGPSSALLGTLNDDGSGNPLLWQDAVTENPGVGDTEEWRIHNFTEDAHPIHVHQVKFKVLGRGSDGSQPPEPWETGFKDAVIAYPGEITRIKAQFDLPGRYVWHCHIVEHEDNEMMRPFQVGPMPTNIPVA